MKFKVDENLPKEVAELLTQAAHDAVTVNDEGLQGTLDTKLAQICRTEERVLVTLDMGFADIRSYPPQSLPGLIVLRLAKLDKTTVLDTLRRTIPLVGQEPLAQHLWIVEETRIRIRGSEA